MFLLKIFLFIKQECILVCIFFPFRKLSSFEKEVSKDCDDY